MDKSQAIRFVDEHMDDLKTFFGVHGWTIYFTFNETGNKLGSCTRLGEYRDATINISPDGHDDDYHLLSTLAHEYFHILLWPFDTYRNVVEPYLDGSDTPADRANMVVYHHSIEMMINNLDFLWRHHLRDDYLEKHTDKGWRCD